MQTTPLEEIEALVLRLPAADRSRLTECLLDSLTGDDEILIAWGEEADRRSEAFDRGELSAVEIDEALTRIRSVLPGVA